VEEITTPHPHIPTNDGSHRITVMWTSPTDVREFEQDKRRLNEALFTLMITLFKDTDGVFYRRESEELLEQKQLAVLRRLLLAIYFRPKSLLLAHVQ
jgi:hypothetical protein